MIKINNVSFSYKTDEILKNINLEVNEGEFIAIVGKNGSGKSTLAKIISGIEQPSKGNVKIDEINLNKEKKLLRKTVGVVFQNPENQILFNNVHDDICFALDNLELEDKEKRIENALQQVNMSGFIQASTYELSLGQKQRITIAGVLAINPKYIILDEPTTMIDSEGKEEIYKILKSLKSQGYTIIYITNAIDEILMADRIIIMNSGEIKTEFKKEAIIENIANLKKYNIKIPQLVEIIYELNNENINIQLKDWNYKELIYKLIEEYKNEKWN